MMDVSNYFNPYLENEYTKTFSGGGQRGGGKPVATLSLSIPTRKKFIDRRGRTRRVALKYEVNLIGGLPGTFDGIGAINAFGKGLKTPLAPKALTTQLVQKICKLMNS